MKMKTRIFVAVSLLFAGLLCQAQVVGTNILLNPSFEGTPFDTNWFDVFNSAPAGVGATNVPGLVIGPGETTAAWLDRNNVYLGQDLLDSSLNFEAAPNWYLDFSLAITNDNVDRDFILMVNVGATCAQAIGASYDVINLRYQVVGGVGQWNAYGNGSFGSDLGLGSMLTSIDADGNGSLNDPGDNKNVYHVRLTGHGWGSPGSSYDIQVSDANQTNFTHSVNGLQRWQFGSGDNGVPWSFYFNSQFGNCPGFWVDNVTFENLTAADPALGVTNIGDIFGLLPLDTGIVTNVVGIINNGASQSLTVSGARISGVDASNYTVNATFPFTLSPGQERDVPVVFNPGGVSKAFSATLVLTNNSSTPAYNVNLGAVREVTGTPLLSNGGFEASPFDAGWMEPTNLVQLGGGLVAGSTNSALLANAGEVLGQNLVTVPGDWHLDCYFAITATNPAAAAFDVAVNTVGLVGTKLDNAKVDLESVVGETNVFGLTTWQTNNPPPLLLPSVDANGNGSLNDPGDTKNVYRLRITGHHWATADSTTNSYTTVELSGANSTQLKYFATSLSGSTSVPSSMVFDTLHAIGSSAFWVDNVQFYAGLAAPELYLTKTNNQVMLSWSGGNLAQLQSASLVNGPYQTVTNAANPYIVTPSGTQFFRVVEYSQ